MAGNANAVEVIPKQLFEQLENAVLFSTSDSPPVNDTIYLRLGAGALVSAGRGQYAAGIDTRPVALEDEPVEVILDPQEVTDFVRAAKKIKGYGGKTARCDLVVGEEAVTVRFGSEEFTMTRSELAADVESDDEHEGIYDHLFRMVDENRAWQAPNRMVILRKMFKLLDKVKPGETSKDDDPFAFLMRPEGDYGNGLVTCRVGPVRVYQVAAEVD